MNRLLIARISKATTILFMHCYQPGIWFARLTMSADDKALSPIVALGGNLDDISEAPIEIGSVISGVNQYTPVTSIAEMYLQEYSFFWDNGNQTIYIRFDNPWFTFKPITGGIIRTFADKVQYDGSGFATPYTESLDTTLILDSVDISQSIDPQEYGIFRYDDISLEIDNSDGRYDSMNDTSAGQVLEILFGVSETEITESDMKVARSGFVESFAFNGNSLKVSGRDKRKKWSKKINTETFNATDYPSLDDRNYDKRLPLCIGQCFNVPCVRVNTGTTQFMFTSDAYGDAVSVDQVYVDGVANAHTGTETDGTFLVTGYSSGTVTADVTGVDKGNDVEKILWLLEEFEGLGYVPSNFNTGEIEIAKTDAKTGGLYIGTSGEKLDSVIERLLVNMGGWLFQQGDIFTIRVFDDDRASVREIEQDEIIGDVTRSYNEDEFVSSVTTYYKKDEKEKEYYADYNDTKEDEAIKNQYRINNKDIFTTLLNSTDARAVGQRYYNRYIDIPATLGMTLGSEIIGIYPTDFITHTLIRPYKMADNGEVSEDVEIIGRSNYQITEIDWNNKSLTAQFVGSAFDEIIVDGGASDTVYDYIYDGGNAYSSYTYTLDGGDA